MSKKGFTLVELLAVIVILGILSTFLVPSIFKMVRNAKNNSYNVLIDSFEENAKLYTSRHRDEIENYLDQYNYYSLTLNDLKLSNLLKTPVIDPRTDEEIDLNKKIYIVRETDQILSICYEDRGCYAPIKLVDKITDPSNIVGSSVQGLHQDITNNFYYYNGSNPNNWIEFNGKLWRIVKVNSDRSIKLIYEGTRNNNGTNENGAISNGTFDNSNSNNFNNSITIKTTLQNWYNSNIDANNKAKVLPVQWCIGKVTYSTSGVTKSSFLSGECGTKTSATSSIGLLSGSEYLYGSLDSTCLTAYKTTGDNGYTCKNQNYLYKNVYNYWTTIADNTATNVWTVQSIGSLGSPVSANSSNHIRPVITLRNDVYIDRGNGTFEKPYVLKDIISVDKTNPVVTLSGDNPVNIGLGTIYTDAGATAIDNVDGDITSKIIRISNLNINMLGSYTITYVVSDISGNKATATRTVNVLDNLTGPEYIKSKGVNGPVLAQGMVPIKWDSSSNKWIDTSAGDTDWYNYTTADKKWANVRTQDGSMWVWIPRYVYKISSGWHSNTTGTIDVQFSMGIDDTRGGTVTLDLGTTSNASNNKWTSHPAFTFGTTPLTGIWAAKFEATAVEGVANGYTADNTCPIVGDNVTTKTIKIIPNVTSWRCINIGNMFTNIRNMETNPVYGWAVASGLQSNGSFTTDSNNIDTHLMKNTEWGAVSYLSKSNYGQGVNEIWINNSQKYITGCAGNSVSEGIYDGCQNTYETTNGVKASTTGNIYGIYDISGGAWDYVSAYVNNGNVNLAVQGSSIMNAGSQYKDVYTVTTDNQATNYGNALNQKGDAVYETSNAGTGNTSWFGDSSSMSYTTSPWFSRGGRCINGSSAGAFAFLSYGGSPGTHNGFRPVIIVNQGL